MKSCDLCGHRMLFVLTDDFAGFVCRSCGHGKPPEDEEKGGAALDSGKEAATPESWPDRGTK